jgi:hypothetical protein
VTLQAGVENRFDKAYAEHIERSDIDDPFLVYQLAAGRSLVLRGVARFGEEVTRPLLDPDQVGRVFRAIT